MDKLVQNSYLQYVAPYDPVTSSELTSLEDSLNSAIDSLVLPAECTNKLSPSQVENMKTNVVIANQHIDDAGNSFKAGMAALYSIKKDVKRKNWTALTDSGALNMSGRMARDLVRAYETWVDDSDVPSAALARVSARVLARIGTVDAGKRTHAINKIKKGEGYTEQDISKIIGNTKSGIRRQIDDLVAQAEKETNKKADDEKAAEYGDIKIQNIRLQDKLEKQIGLNKELQRIMGDLKAENKKLSQMLAKAKDAVAV